jgi:hypothetical protein
VLQSSRLNSYSRQKYRRRNDFVGLPSNRPFEKFQVVLFSSDELGYRLSRLPLQT